MYSLELLNKITLMSTHNIHFHDKMRKFFLKYPWIFDFSSYWENFLGTQKLVGVSHGIQVIKVLESLLYLTFCMFN